MADSTHQSESTKSTSVHSIIDTNRSSNDQTKTVITAWAQARRKITIKS